MHRLSQPMNLKRRKKRKMTHLKMHRLSQLPMDRIRKKKRKTILAMTDTSVVEMVTMVTRAVAMVMMDTSAAAVATVMMDTRAVATVTILMGKVVTVTEAVFLSTGHNGTTSTEMECIPKVPLNAGASTTLFTLTTQWYKRGLIL